MKPGGVLQANHFRNHVSTASHCQKVEVTVVARHIAAHGLRKLVVSYQRGDEQFSHPKSKVATIPEQESQGRKS